MTELMIELPVSVLKETIQTLWLVRPCATDTHDRYAVDGMILALRLRIEYAEADITSDITV